MLNNKKLNFHKDWKLSTILNMPKDTTYIFTTDDHITIFIDHDCNLDKDMTYGWSIVIYDNNMTMLNGFGYDTAEELEQSFKNITKEIESFLSTKNICTLEQILQIIDNKEIFKANGDFTNTGYKAYQKLISIIYGLNNVLGFKLNANAIVDELDEITNEN